MPIQAKHRQKFGRFKFRVLVPGLGSAAFQSITGLKYNIADIEYWEGGAIVADHEPGRVTFDDCVMERGESYDLDLYNWLRDVVDILAYMEPLGGGMKSPLYKRDFTVLQMDRDNTFAIQYSVAEAYPTTFTSGDQDNTVDELKIESVTLKYRFFVKKNLGS